MMLNEPIKYFLFCDKIRMIWSQEPPRRANKDLKEEQNDKGLLGRFIDIYQDPRNSFFFF